MNSVILHFLEPAERVLQKAESIGIINENCVSERGEVFMFWVYEEYLTEYDPEEQRLLVNMLGQSPVSSFQLLARKNNARFALAKVMELLSLAPGVMDDDKDGLYTLNDIRQITQMTDRCDVYNLKQFINH